MRAKSPMKAGHEDKSMAKMGHMNKSAAKIMKKSPMEIGMKPKSPAKKSTRPVKLKIYFNRFTKPEELPRSFLAGADQTLKRYSILKIVTEKISNA